MLGLIAQNATGEIEAIHISGLRGERAITRFSEILVRHHEDLATILEGDGHDDETIEAALAELDYRIHRCSAASKGEGKDLQAVFAARETVETN